MNEVELSELVNRALFEVAPDLGGKPLSSNSMGFPNFIIGFHRALGDEIPDAGYPQSANLKDRISCQNARSV